MTRPPSESFSRMKALKRADIERLSPQKLRELADWIVEGTAHRGLFVRLNAALAARGLREMADERERQP